MLKVFHDIIVTIEVGPTSEYNPGRPT